MKQVIIDIFNVKAFHIVLSHGEQRSIALNMYIRQTDLIGFTLQSETLCLWASRFFIQLFYFRCILRLRERTKWKGSNYKSYNLAQRDQ